MNNKLSNLTALANSAKKPVGKAVLSVEINEVISKKQVRKTFSKIEELAQTLIEEGQQSPIIVSPKNENGKYVIQKGERRWRAALHAKLPNIDLIINSKVQTNVDAIAGELIENIQREDLLPMEIALALNELLEEGGIEQQSLAQRIGKPKSYVSKHLSLLKLPDCVLSVYEQGISQDIETLNNLRLIYNQNEGLCLSLCQLAVSDGISRKFSRVKLDEVKDNKNQTLPVKKNESSKEGAVKGKAKKKSGVFVSIKNSENKVEGLLVTGRSSEKDKVWVDFSEQGGSPELVSMSELLIVNVRGR